MTHHNHKHSGSREHVSTAQGEFSRKKLHKDWRVWLVVGMMLAAMVVYVLTMDDSIVPALMRQ